MQIHFNKKSRFGRSIFCAAETDSISLYEYNNQYYISMLDESNNWISPDWCCEGFDSAQDAEEFLSERDWESSDIGNIGFDNDELWDIYDLIGIEYDEDSDSYRYHDESIDIQASCDNPLSVNISEKGKKTHRYFKSLSDMFRAVESAIARTGKHIFRQHSVSVNYFQKITAAINTKNLASQLQKVSSSNVWAYGLFTRSRKDRYRDLIVQFKAKEGGPGDIYIYYDVPFTLFRRWQATQSKGHFFWKHIRNYFKYSKLTGDKIGKLPNAINHYTKDFINLTPTCQYMLEMVIDFLDGRMSRQEFESDIPQYYDMAKQDMLSENKRFANYFNKNILKAIKQDKDYSDETFKNVIRKFAKELNNMIAPSRDFDSMSKKESQTETPTTNEETQTETPTTEETPQTPVDTDPTPTCRLVLSIVADFLRGKISRSTFEKNIADAYNSMYQDMVSEDKRFADVFRTKILRAVQQDKNYSDESLRNVILPDARYLSRRIDADDTLDSLSIKLDRNAYGRADTKPTCRTILEMVIDFVNGKIDRDEFESDIQEYYKMGKPDMDREDKRFSELFRTKILNELEADQDYSDKSLRNVIKKNVNDFLINRVA